LSAHDYNSFTTNCLGHKASNLVTHKILDPFIHVNSSSRNGSQGSCRKEQTCSNNGLSKRSLTTWNSVSNFNLIFSPSTLQFWHHCHFHTASADSLEMRLFSLPSIAAGDPDSKAKILPEA